MASYVIGLRPEGYEEFEVEAASEQEAIQIALRDANEFGEVEWSVEYVDGGESA